MVKNTSGQKVGAQMVSATDGSAFTGSVTVAVTGDAGTQATGSVGSGVCTHEGNGYHTYAPSQAETNYDLIAFTFTGTGAVPQTVQVYTKAGDAFTRLGADGAGLSSIPWNAAWDAEVQSEATDALNAYDPPTNAEMEARTLTAAQVEKLAANAEAVVLVVIGTGSTTTSIVLDPATGINAGAPPAQADTFNSRVLIIKSGALLHQAVSISDYASGTLTVGAFTGAPAAGVVGIIL